MSERSALALVYVKGPTPLHLPLSAYGHFDGTTWREEPCCDQRLPAEKEPHGTWLRLPWSPSSFLSGTVSHRVKIGELDSSPMPVPSHVTRFRVGSVNRLDFFGWAQYGIIRMTDRTVPAGTVIDSEARTVDSRQLLSCSIVAQLGNQSDHHLSFVGSYTVTNAVMALAKSWAQGLPEGWCQIEAVVAKLRRGYAHDRSATVSPGCRDVVAEFLLESHRGPDYLFASSTAVILRSLGYPTRLVSGLYAAPGKYDAQTGHTPVTRDDVHFWVEVRLPDGLWVAVEPTPGYELLPPVRAWSEIFADVLLGLGGWVTRHCLGLLASLCGLGFVGYRRRNILDGLATARFHLAPARQPRRFVFETLKLIESRARLAGRARPPGATLYRWYSPIACESAVDPGGTLLDLVRLADWAAHAPRGEALAWPRGIEALRQTCRRAAQTWTLERFLPGVKTSA